MRSAMSMSPQDQMPPVAPAEPPKARASGTLRNFYNWCLDHDFLCALYVLAVMLALAALSAPIGIHSVQFDGWIEYSRPIEATATQVGSAARADGRAAVETVRHRIPFVPGQAVEAQRTTKEVGYLMALNWALYSVLVVPVMTLFILRLWRTMPETLAGAAARGLIRSPDLSLLSEEAATGRWRQLRRTCAGLFAILVFCVVAFVGWDWWEVVGHPITDPSILSGLGLWDNSLEFDWSIACLYPSGPGSCGGVFAFGLVAYLLIAIGSVALAFASCVVAAIYVAYLCGGLGRREARFTHVVVPSVDGDSRGGFEIFGSFFSALFGLSISVVIGCLMMIIQNAYLRDPDDGDVFTFMFGDLGTLVRGVRTANVESAFDFAWVEWLFDPADRVFGNQQTGIGLLLLAMTVILSTGMSWWLLRQTAQDAQTRSWKEAPALATEFGLDEASFREQIRTMDFWPVGWMNQNQLLVLLLSLMASVFSYRLMLLPAAWVAVQGGQAIWKLFAGRAARRRDRFSLP